MNKSQLHVLREFFFSQIQGEPIYDREGSRVGKLLDLAIRWEGGLILLPQINLIAVMFWSQVINGAMLPFVLIFMLILINNRDIMGD